MPLTRVVIGKNFGDEGKGLAVDYFSAAFSGKTLVIRHNGGAQSGHTVELLPKAEGGSGGDLPGRFIFHELSSGSFRKADTFWVKTFFPDLYKLADEAENFRSAAGFVPKIFCDPEATPVLLDDVLRNQMVEAGRGDARHGSCGMGINESFLRKKAGFGIPLGEIMNLDEASLAKRLFQVREEYGRKRVRELLTEIGYHSKQERVEEYLELLESDEIILAEAEAMVQNRKLIQIVPDAASFVRSYDQVIFETGQGLLLDQFYKPFRPHLTTSRTGMTNPAALLAEWNLPVKEVCYVTRTYVTRHGAGPLPYETSREELGIAEPDQTNQTNEWQGTIRYAPHGTTEEFLEAVLPDLEGVRADRVTLFVTHLNETDGRILLTKERRIPAEEDPSKKRQEEVTAVSPEQLWEIPQIRAAFSGMYLSDSRDQIRTKYCE